MRTLFLGLSAFAAVVALQETSQAQENILGSASSFAVLGGSTVTNTGPTVITGDLGVAPGLAITGFPPGLVIAGVVHVADAVAQQAQDDITIAYTALAARAPTQILTGMDLGGLTLVPGVYSFASSAFLTSSLTLDAQGDPDAQFIFQIGSTLITSSASSVLVINAADGCNVYWQVGSSATLGTATAFTGNILALASITLNTGAVVNDGRLFARTGAITLDTNTISADCIVPTPGAAALIGSLVVGGLGSRKRRR